MTSMLPFNCQEVAYYIRCPAEVLTIGSTIMLVLKYEIDVLEESHDVSQDWLQ